MASEPVASPTLVEFIEAAFEEPDLRRAAQAVRAGKADDRLGRLYEMWPEWASSWQPPQGDERQIYPYVFNNWVGYDGGGLAGAWMDLVGRSERAGVLRQQLIRHLLFCDGVAVPDPLVRSTSSRRALPRVAGMVNDRPARRTWAASAIESIHSYRDLIGDGVIVVVPTQAHLPRLAPAATSALKDPAAYFPPPPAEWWGLTHAQVAAIDIATQLATAQGCMDPYLPTAGHVAVFRDLARSADGSLRNATGSAAPHEYNALLPRVLTCSLPDPDAVSIADLVAIRRDGHFIPWRNAVADGVKQFTDLVGSDPDDWPNAGEGLRHSLSERVQDEAERQKAAIGWSGNSTVNVTIDLALIGGTGVSAFVAPPVAAGLAGLEGARLLAGLFRRWQFGRGAFSRHVAVFSKPT